MKKTTVFASVFVMLGAFALLAMQGFGNQYSQIEARDVRGGACNESKSANDGSCREECSGGVCEPLDPDHLDTTAYECVTSIAPEGNPGGSQSGYALLKNADGWKSACNHPESGTTTCSSTTIACAIEVKCLRTCDLVGPFSENPEWVCKTNQSSENNTERGKHSDYSASGVACPVQ